MAEAVASCGEGAGAVTIGSRTKGSSSAPNAEANARQNAPGQRARSVSIACSR